MIDDLTEGQSSRAEEYSIAEFGAPFLGTPPTINKEAFSQQMTTIYRTGYGVFRLWRRQWKVMGRTYASLLEGIAQGHVQWMTPPRYGWFNRNAGKRLVYVEWCEMHVTTIDQVNAVRGKLNGLSHQNDVVKSTKKRKKRSVGKPTKRKAGR